MILLDVWEGAEYVDHGGSRYHKKMMDKIL